MMRKIQLLVLVSFLFSAYHLKAQEWIVPDDAQQVKNPLEYNLDNVKAGKALYLKNCKSCHGDPGKNNPLPLVPSPVDIASEKMHLNTEGAMFYKISKGRGTMLQFELTLSPNEIWSLVSFIMNYKPGGEQLLVDLPPVKANLLASLNPDESFLSISAKHADPEMELEYLKEAPILISLQRAFGKLKIGEVFTDENGNAEFSMPDNFIRDDEGLMTLVVSMNEDFEAKEVVLKSTIKGTPKDMPQILEEGVLYSTNDRLPLWLLLSFGGMVGGVWLVIGYVVLQIIKVKKLSKN